MPPCRKILIPSIPRPDVARFKEDSFLKFQFNLKLDPNFHTFREAFELNFCLKNNVNWNQYTKHYLNISPKFKLRLTIK